MRKNSAISEYFSDANLLIGSRRPLNSKSLFPTSHSNFVGEYASRSIAAISGVGSGTIGQYAIGPV